MKNQMHETNRISKQTEFIWVKSLLESLEDTGLHPEDMTSIFLKAVLETCIENKMPKHKFDQIVDDLKITYSKLKEENNP